MLQTDVDGDGFGPANFGPAIAVAIGPGRGASLVGRLTLAPVILGAVILTSAWYNIQVLSWQQGLHSPINSDTLLPMDMAWDLHHNPLAWHEFQWPRVPSLFPDMVYFWACEWAGIAWRHALLGYTLLMVASITVALGIVIKHLRRGAELAPCLAIAAIATGTVVMAAVLGAHVQGLDNAEGLENWKDLLLVFAPVSHGNSLLLSLLAAPISLKAWRGERLARIAVLGLCALGTFGDLLFIIQFLIPFILATRLPALSQLIGQGGEAPMRMPWRTLVRFDVMMQLIRPDRKLLRDMAMACAAGWAMTFLLFRQPVSEVKMHGPKFVFTHLGHDILHAPWMIACLAGTVILALTAWVRVKPMLLRPGNDMVWEDRTLLLVLGSLAAVLSVCLLALVYSDPLCWRYAMPVVWWPLAVAASVVSLPRGRLVQGLGAMAGSAAMLLGMQISRTSPPGLLTWHFPIESCLTANSSRYSLHAGLANYWYARKIAASSEWQLQIAQVLNDGAPGIWGNDRSLYHYDSHHPGLPALFDFIVMTPDSLREETIKRYGPPALIFGCEGAEI